MRLFLGLPLCEDAVAVLEDVQAQLDLGRLVPEDNLHLTLAFLDEQPKTVAEALHAALEEMTLPGAAISFDGVEVRGRARPRLAWAAVTRTPALRALRDKVRGAAVAAGVDLPRDRFRPHVTLARFGPRVAGDPRLDRWLAEMAALRAGPYAVDRVCLYRSTLTPDGPLYDVLAAYPLAAASGGSGGPSAP
ncbi:RNA 2',3'-cyclic phosphodiesterase [Roseovarius aestuariivivens]|uniref:RNA 2',3'-cyclic phosphodiesterase n=1 Tax=Roseovarius aestuariivivens TaxID=1888910 RepID=UPI001081686C|nr:RNA 2',3'-cyclic phosphodiesterase [Roseovarius aestuariivivens]